MSTSLESITNDRELKSLEPPESLSIHNKLKSHNLKENQIASQTFSFLEFLKKPTKMFDNTNIFNIQQLNQKTIIIIILIWIISLLGLLILLFFLYIMDTINEKQYRKEIKIIEKILLINILMIIILIILSYFTNSIIRNIYEIYYEYISHRNSNQMAKDATTLTPISYDYVYNKQQVDN